jgi:hypothetical protein
MKAYWGSGGIAPRILTSAIDGGDSSAPCPGSFTPREKAPGTHWIGGWVGPRGVLDAVVKRKIPSPRFEPQNPDRPACSPALFLILALQPVEVLYVMFWHASRSENNTERGEQISMPRSGIETSVAVCERQPITEHKTA